MKGLGLCVRLQKVWLGWMKVGVLKCMIVIVDDDDDDDILVKVT